MKKLNEQEVLELAKIEYPMDKSMQDFLVGKYDYYLVADKYVIEFEKVKNLSIRKDIYYDDETEAPEINLDTFISYNLRMNFRNAYNYRETMKGHTGLNKNNKTTYYIDSNRYRRDDFTVEYLLTDNDKADIYKIEDDAKTAYIERLTKYFKRYEKLIYPVGYWANR